MAAKETPPWKQFEKRVEDESKAIGLTVWRVPAEVRIINRAGAKFPIQIKSLPDYAGGIFGFACFFDAKATQGPSWNLKNYVFRDDDSSNKIHQYHRLKAAKDAGNIAGYLIWFYTLGQITWCPIEAIEEMVSRGIPSVDPDSILCTSLATPSTLISDASSPISLMPEGRVDNE